MENSLFKSFGVLWKPFENRHGELQLENTPYCPTEGCRTTLGQIVNGFWYCVHCDKKYPTKDGFSQDETATRQKFEGFKIKDWEVYSLDLPPTKIAARDEDASHWISARITEKGGKRLGVVYFGEKKDKQSNKDYSQLFVELENDEIRFDKGNANPKELLARLEVEFRDTKIVQTIKEG